MGSPLPALEARPLREMAMHRYLASSAQSQVSALKKSGMKREPEGTIKSKMETHPLKRHPWCKGMNCAANLQRTTCDAREPEYARIVNRA